MKKDNQYCEFCQILHKKDTNQLIIAQHDTLFAFHDLNTVTAEAHILVCTKQHIQSALDIKDLNILHQMQTFGYQVLRNIYLQKFNKQPQKSDFRLGFHLPPHISIFHIHMHCLILPIKNKLYDKYLYGFGLKSINTIKQKIKSQPTPKL